MCDLCLVHHLLVPRPHSEGATANAQIPHPMAGHHPDLPDLGTNVSPQPVQTHWHSNNGNNYNIIIIKQYIFSSPGSSVHGILQARILQWLPFPFPGGLPNPRIEPESSMFFTI